MKKLALKATIRELVGRKVKNLRKNGQLPATVYGKKVKSITVAVSEADFKQVYEEAGETGLIELTVGNETRPVLVHNVQTDAIYSKPLHIEFHQVDLKEKVHANIPLVMVGISQAVADKKGVLLTLVDEIEVEALPQELPENIEVDVAKLAEVNSELHVSDLKIPTGVTLLTESTVGVVRIGELVTKETEETTAPPPVAPMEGEVAPAEGGLEKAEVSGEEKAPPPASK
jgi:large subunit ribosomal protein L25